MSFLALMARNILTRKLRSSLTGVAVAIGIMTVVALGVLTHSLRQTAISILQTGKADFTVAQKGVSDILYSALSDSQVATVRSYPGIQSVVGVLIAASKLDANHPFFLELGMPPDQLAPFGVQILSGRAYDANAQDQIMLGYRIAADLHKTVGDPITVDRIDYHVVGIYSVGNVFGDTASLLPLTWLQDWQRQPGTVTLAFVKVKPGTNIDALRATIEKDNPGLATVQSESDFGLVDRNLALLSAANVATTILALVIGAIGVMNTTVMSVFERTREFGVLRAVGWTRARLVSLVMGEALLISLAGAAVGLALGYAAIRLLERVPEVVGVLQPDYPVSIFGRALGIAFGMAFIGAIYPAARAALLEPMDALRHE